MVLKFDTERIYLFSNTGLLPSLASLSKSILLKDRFNLPHCGYWHLSNLQPLIDNAHRLLHLSGLDSSLFARHY